MSQFYITTTLPYVNASPHIGHTLEFIQADTIARRKRWQIWSENVIFNVWTDEHGLKIFEKAQEGGKNIKEFVDENAQTFIDFCKLLDVSYDNFYRTSDTSHHHVAQHCRNTCNKNNHIYKKAYTGLYCVGCESFKTEKDLDENGHCPDHAKAPIKHEEENYFFRLSDQKEPLLNYIDQNDNFIIPHTKKQELRNFVADIKDISISRNKKNLPRGIPVPHDDEQVMYVRFDALTNYVGAVGYPDDKEKLEKFRPGIQLCGPDNLRFQWAIRQWMLHAADLPFSKNILVHGMIMWPDGNKMSKTLGNVISPFDQVEKFGIEAVRYYLIAGIPTYGDAAYKEEELINLYNSHLANSFGNLLNRVIHLANKKEIKLTKEQVSQEQKEKITQHEEKIINAYNNYQLYDAAGEIHQLCAHANKYMDENKPRDKSLDQKTITQILNNLSTMLHSIIKRYTPIIPHSCQTAQEMLDKQEKGILFEKINNTKEK